MARVVVIGGGHNGLVAAVWLIRSGHQVVVVESRLELGGACHTKRFPCGCHLDPGANAYGMLEQSIHDAIAEVDPPMEVLRADPGLVLCNFATGSSLAIFDSPTRTADLIEASTRDKASSVHRYLADLNTVCQALEQSWNSPPENGDALRLPGLPDVWSDNLERGSLAAILRDYFEDVRTQELFAATNILTNRLVDDQGSAAALPYLGLSRIDGEPGWGTIMGGMGEVPRRLGLLLDSLGAEIRTGTSVHGIEERSRRGTHTVRLDNGEFLEADAVVATCDPVTLASLIQDVERRHRIEGSLDRLDFSGGCAKINALLDRPFDLDVVKGLLRVDQIPLLVVNGEFDALRASLNMFQRGLLPTSPYVEVVPTYELDPSASCGEHFPVSLYSLYFPTGLGRGSRIRDEAARSLWSTLQPILGDGAGPVWQEVLLPDDLQQRYGMMGGHVDHGPMEPGNLYEQRPFGSTQGLLEGTNIVLAGAGAHPGGLVSGRSGQLGAAAVDRLLMSGERP